MDFRHGMVVLEEQQVARVAVLHKLILNDEVQPFKMGILEDAVQLELRTVAIVDCPLQS